MSWFIIALINLIILMPVCAGLNAWVLIYKGWCWRLVFGGLYLVLWLTSATCISIGWLKVLTNG